MGVLRSFAIRREFEIFCSFFENANENRPLNEWMRRDSESADPYLNCLQKIHEIFEDGSSSSSFLKKSSRDDYYALEDSTISLICGHKMFDTSRAVFKKEMMHREGRKAFQRKLSLLPRVRFYDSVFFKFLFFRGINFWESWITTFICFMTHIHQLREWLIAKKRCVAAFGSQKVGKSRFWSNSLGINTSPSHQSNTVQTQMWMVPHSQFIDFPAFSEENKLGDSYNAMGHFVRCDMRARDIVYDFLLVPDICVYIVKTISPSLDSIERLIAHVRDLETNRYPIINALDGNFASSGSKSDLARARSAGGTQSGRNLSSHNRLARESILLCSHTQNFICRLEPLRLEELGGNLNSDPNLLSLDQGNMTSEQLAEIFSHPELNKARFVWVCGDQDGANEKGHAVQIIKKVEGKAGWSIAGLELSAAKFPSAVGQAVVDVQQPQLNSAFEIWKKLRAKLMKKKQTISEMFPSKNVFLAYFAEYATEFNVSPYSRDVENHIENDFPWSSAFCASMLPDALRDPPLNTEESLEDLPILNAAQCLELILKKMFDQMHADRLIKLILVRHKRTLHDIEEVSQAVAKNKKCEACVADDDMRDESKHQNVNFVCDNCTANFSKQFNLCAMHSESHRTRRGEHNVHEAIDEAKQKKRIAELKEREKEEQENQNSYTNRKMREKIWQHKESPVVLRGQTSIDALCADMAQCCKADASCGHIDCMLKLLTELQTMMTFSSSQVANTCEALSSKDVNIGVVLWSYLMGDFDEPDEKTTNWFSADRLKWRTLGEVRELQHAADSTIFTRFRDSRLLSAAYRPSLADAYVRTPEQVFLNFIHDANVLWNEIKDGGRYLQSKFAEMKPITVTVADPQNFATSEINMEKGDLSSETGMRSTVFRRVVPWFSAVFFEMLRESNCLDFHVTKLQMVNDYSLNVVSQDFCLAVLKIILLPLLASKKCSHPSVVHDLRVLLHYGDDFFLTFYYLEKAMVSCVNSEGVGAKVFSPLFDWLSIKSSSEDHSIRSVEALRILLQNISLTGLMELEILDFLPCITALVCENLASVLSESRSTFALESFMSRSGLDYAAREHTLRALIENTQQAFNRVDQWLLKPLLQIEGNIGKDWKTVSKISRQSNFEHAFKISAAISKQFESVKRNMHRLVDGSYAAVSITVFEELLIQLEKSEKELIEAHSCIDVPLFGRALMGLKHLDTVFCYMVEPCFSCFECKLVCISFQHCNGIGKENQFLRLSLLSLKEMKIELIPKGGKFEFIVSNCSTAFIEEFMPIADIGDRVKPISPDHVRWCDLSLPECKPGSIHPEPLDECRVYLQPLVTVGPSIGGDHPSPVHSTGCIVGQRVTMNISFCLPRPTSNPLRIYVVLDDAFHYDAQRKFVTFLPMMQEEEYRIIDVFCPKSKSHYRLLEVSFNPDGNKREGRITLSFEAKNPSGERLFRRACFVYLKVDVYCDDRLFANHTFAIKSSVGERSRLLDLDTACFACGVAQTPAIHNIPLTYCEMLVSKTLLGETSVDIMLTFVCSVDVLLCSSSSDSRQAVIEIKLPQAWPLFPEHVSRRHVEFLGVDADDKAVDVRADHGEIVGSKITIKLSASRNHQVLNKSSKCRIVIKDVTLPQAPAQLLNALENTKEYNTQLAAGGHSESAYEELKTNADDAASKLLFLKENLTSGCIAIIKDANGSIVMTGHEIPISPLLAESEYATVIERKTFEESEYNRINEKITGESTLYDFKFGRLVEEFSEAFVLQLYGGDADIAKRHKFAMERFHEKISEALSDKSIANLRKKQARCPAQDPRVFKIYAMAVQACTTHAATFVSVNAIIPLTQLQLWTSPFILEIDHQRFKFFQILNRYALSADNGELLTKGMLLIKAICRNIVSPDASDARAAKAAVAAEGAGGGGAAAAIIVSPTKPLDQFDHKFYYRGGSLPFEMVSNR
jgi:hypothetical protein